MSFIAIRDQAVPIRLLRHMLERSRVPNGLLLWGPGGVGKRLTALEVAKAVNCAEGKNDACDRCLTCRKITSGNHPDVRMVAPVKRARVIDVETVETINEFAALRAFESAWRVFIILDAERMNLPAQNHFLKTLEEPAGRSLFILVTEFPRMLLPTIRSRCQQIRFGTLRPETVAELLIRERGLPRDQAEALAELSQGQMSRALDLVDSDKRAVVLEITQRLAEGGDPLSVAEEFSNHLTGLRDQITGAVKTTADIRAPEEITREDREQMKAEEQAVIDAWYRHDVMNYLYLFQTWYRDIAVYHATGETALVLNRDQLDRLRAAAPIHLDEKVEAVGKARTYLERFINEERVFRDLFFALAS
ncbi:MAG TPA: DNA polymerase III subunit delta' [Candidatus Hydrogenedentes bacterium]|nr:DNA polymerase III subunit delta' [Candidatus Hydrogenedentota bacterium]HPG68805.1 DNA polymerase III subunit delta' [Candidatus Hydrogenedentota bacterium]